MKNFFQDIHSSTVLKGSSSEEEIQPLQKSKPGGLLVLISIILFNIVSISFKNLRQMFTDKIKRY